MMFSLQKPRRASSCADLQQADDAVRYVPAAGRSPGAGSRGRARTGAAKHPAAGCRGNPQVTVLLALTPGATMQLVALMPD
jgi:hypothetical protein